MTCIYNDVIYKYVKTARATLVKQNDILQYCNKVGRKILSEIKTPGPRSHGKYKITKLCFSIVIRMKKLCFSSTCIAARNGLINSHI